ncbi:MULTISPECIES: GerW family sporulation protein [unclassified Ruminococcus]|uniref:GerW family sporulation protein n=1 Tax=unclassified Ruminococcus TaxID=2608920 RepID=UPI00210F100E|nr:MULTISPECIES: GerW family sporulation protein [unclassified Ruminococcus]MCQ4022168.1 sporulation protein YtfJ [Ruminococcus sp. zg-924]MCQ4115566.1 sporulation protein YtfJ [Ruminococcus sp. zg-921]
MSEQQNHPIQGLMDTTLDKIKQLIDVNTIIGTPITTPDGTTIVPVSKVSYGFASGGSDIPSKNAINKQVFGGGSGAGVSITPIAFIVVNQGDAKILRIDNDSNTADKIAETVPQVIDTISGIFKKDKKKTEDKEIAE